MDPAFRVTPFAHQLAEFTGHRHDRIRRNNWEQGLGKSKDLIDTVCALHVEDGLEGLLLLSPSGVHRNWVETELPLHLWEDLMPRTKVHLYLTERSTTKHHQRAVQELIAHRELAILSMSYDGYMTLAGRQAATRFMETRRVMVALDEASDIKTPKAKRTQAVIRTGWRAHWRRTLDGTPISNGPFDVYAPTKFLDEDFWKRIGLSTFSEFKQHFGVWERNGLRTAHGLEDKLIGYHRLDELREMLAPITTRVTKDEALDLPAKMYRRRVVELSSEQRRVYNALRDTYTAELADGRTITQPLALVRLLRLQQIACGYVPVDDDGTEDPQPMHVLPGANHRLEAMEAEVHAAPGKVLIWARFRLDVDLIMQRLRGMGVPAVRFDGAVSEDERAAAERSFQDREDGARVMVVTQAKGYRGYTWTRGRTVIYYSNTFSLLHRLQSEDRSHRIGTKHPVDYVDLVAPGTVDDHLVKSLRSKFDVAAQVNGDNYRAWI